MIQKFSLSLLILVVSLLTSTRSIGQENFVTVNLTAASLDSRILDIKYESSGKVESLNVFSNQRTASFRYIGPPTLVFFREGEALGPDGKPIRVPVASCKIDRNVSEQLLIFSGQHEQNDRYNVFAMADDWQKFSGGTFRFLNLSPYDIAFKLGDRVHRIARKDITDVHGGFSEDGSYEAKIKTFPKGSEPVLVFDGYINYSKNLRLLYIVLPHPSDSTGAVSFLTLPQRVQKSGT